MTSKYSDIMAALRADKYAPIYVLCGEEPYYIDRVYDFIATHALDEMAREFDQQTVYGRDLQGADIAQVISAARDKRQNLWKKVAEHPQVVWLQSDKLRDYEVEKWILNYIAEYNSSRGRNEGGLTIDPKVAPLLADHLGTDLSAIVGALDKLIAGRPEGVNTIDAALVERNIGISKDYNIMELQSALIRGDVAKANRIAQYFGGSKDHPMIREMAPLFTFFSNLLMYHYLPNKTQAVVAKELGINPYFVKDYEMAARRYSAGKTFLIIGYLRETDARLKGINNPSAKDPDLWKELIYKIMH